MIWPARYLLLIHPTMNLKNNQRQRQPNHLKMYSTLLKTIVQWNCRGLRANKDELQILDNQLRPAVFCLQETQLNDQHPYNLKGFTSYSHNTNTGDRAHGGTMIMVANAIPHQPIPIISNLQAIAIRLTMHKLITVCSIYIPPNASLDQVDLNNLTMQLP